MNTPTIDKALFCPRCHSPAVEFGIMLLDQAPATCNACGWKGLRGDLLAAPYLHNMGNGEEILQRFVNDFRNIIAKDFAVVLGRFLTRWGFLPQEPKEMSKALAKYIQNIAKATITAVLQTRQDIEKEKMNAS
jgi:hypothetical protein